jgi:hypothetical protein
LNAGFSRAASLPAALNDRGEQQRVLHRPRPHGQALGYFYFENEPGRRSPARPLTKDEARRMAANFAKLPELLHSPRDP